MMSKWQNIALDWSFFCGNTKAESASVHGACAHVCLPTLPLPPSLSLSLLHSHMGTFPLKWEENDSVFFFLSKVDFELKHKNVRKSEGVRREREERERWDRRERDASFLLNILLFHQGMVADRRHNLTVGGCTAKRAWPDRVVGSSPLQREEGRCISLSLTLPPIS